MCSHQLSICPSKTTQPKSEYTNLSMDKYYTFFSKNFIKYLLYIKRDKCCNCAEEMKCFKPNRLLANGKTRNMS